MCGMAKSFLIINFFEREEGGRRREGEGEEKRDREKVEKGKYWASVGELRGTSSACVTWPKATMSTTKK
jgi:hypothetical protein